METSEKNYIFRGDCDSNSALDSNFFVVGIKNDTYSSVLWESILGRFSTG